MADIIGSTRPYNEVSGVPVYDAPSTRKNDENVQTNYVIDMFLTLQTASITISEFSGILGGAEILSDDEITFLIDPDVIVRDIYIVSRTDESLQKTTIEKIEVETGTAPTLNDDYNTIRDTVIFKILNVATTPDLTNNEAIFEVDKKYTIQDIFNENLDWDLNNESYSIPELSGKHPFDWGFRWIEIKIDPDDVTLQYRLNSNKPTLFLDVMVPTFDSGSGELPPNGLSLYAYRITYNSNTATFTIQNATHHFISDTGNVTTPARRNVNSIRLTR